MTAMTAAVTPPQPGYGARAAAAVFPVGVLGTLWRALAAYRVGSLAYLTVLIVHGSPGYAHPVLGWAALAVATAWTPVTALGQPLVAVRAPRLLPAFVALDLVVAVLLVLATRAVDTAAHIDAGAPTLPGVWSAGAVLAAALVGGLRAGLGAGAVLALADVVERGRLAAGTIGSVVLLLLEVGVLGYLARAAVRAESELAAARGFQAATAERERLAREVHDGVLQVLALLSREPRDGEEVRRLAGEQERSLRQLVGSPAPRPVAGTVAPVVDLMVLLAPLATARLTVTGPGAPVLLPAAVADDVAAATRALLDNVGLHAGPGARAWVLVEDEPGLVRVGVRDDGRGMAPGREQEAAGQGRLGLSTSVRGRLRDLGGAVDVVSAPGRGTEVELTVPHPTGHEGRTR